MAKIIYFEPKKHVSDLVENELSDDGHKVISNPGLGSLKDLMAFVSNTNPDLVLTEINLIDNNGLDLVQDIRYKFSNLPIIIYTAYDTFKEDIKTLAADFYVIKSFDTTELKNKIRIALESESLNIEEIIRNRLVEVINSFSWNVSNFDKEPWYHEIIESFKKKNYLKTLSKKDIKTICNEIIEKINLDIRRTHKMTIQFIEKGSSEIEMYNEKTPLKLYNEFGPFQMMSTYRFIKEYNSVLSLHNSGIKFFYDEKQEEEIIKRSIEFPPEYFQAGLSILNYFSNILNEKYAKESLKLKIEQEKLKVTMIITTPTGELKDEIEETLNDYGLVIKGKLSPKEFLNNELQIIRLENQLTHVKAQLESERRVFQLQERNYGHRIKSLENDISWLRNHVGNLLQYSEVRTKDIKQISVDAIDTIGKVTNEFQKTINDLLRRHTNISNELSILLEKIDFSDQHPNDEEINDVKEALSVIKRKNPGVLDSLAETFNNFGTGIASSLWANLIISIINSL